MSSLDHTLESLDTKIEGDRSAEDPGEAAKLGGPRAVAAAADVRSRVDDAEQEPEGGGLVDLLGVHASGVGQQHGGGEDGEHLQRVGMAAAETPGEALRGSHVQHGAGVEQVHLLRGQQDGGDVRDVGQHDGSRDGREGNGIWMLCRIRGQHDEERKGLAGGLGNKKTNRSRREVGVKKSFRFTGRG